MSSITDRNLEMILSLNAAIAKWSYDIGSFQRFATETRHDPQSFIGYLAKCSVEEAKLVDILRRSRDEYLIKMEGNPNGQATR